MILGLLIHWATTGKPHYPSMDPNASIAYISDVGAQSLKPLFIAGSVVTTIFLDASFISERYLRHSGSLVPNTSAFQKTMSGLSMAFAVIGTAGLILLSIFSAVFICVEYQRLGIRTSSALPSQPQSTANCL
jgi:hypothetical protein